jgi:hypothetical protein
MAAAAAASLEGMLLDAARLNVRIRRHYASVKRHASARYYTYVLLLQRNKIYVGSSDLLVQRLLEHRTMSPASAKWVREHGPVERVVEVAVNCGPEDEMYKTLEYMSLFGWQHVRGSYWCRSDMRAPPPALAWFERTQQFEVRTVGACRAPPRGRRDRLLTPPSPLAQYMPRSALDLLVGQVDELATELHGVADGASASADDDAGESVASAESVSGGVRQSRSQAAG